MLAESFHVKTDHLIFVHLDEPLDDGVPDDLSAYIYAQNLLAVGAVKVTPLMLTITIPQVYDDLIPAGTHAFEVGYYCDGVWVRICTGFVDFRKDGADEETLYD